ncbi:hypothetical protein LUZ60_001827 [Juncus effusus]|nr:hypothetical protein LUZ60_001827 [Juncus effusus]
MAEVQEVEMARERGDAVKDINSITQTSKEENHGTTSTTQYKMQTYMQQRLDDLPGEAHSFEHMTIFRVPAWFHEVEKKLFEPQVVSIGPYHRGKEELRATEEHKWFFLRDFLARNDQVRFEVYIKEIKALEMQARICYSETIDMSSDDFVMMLILDGCFLLECFLKQKFKEPDALLVAAWVESGVYSDMLLLENQIPFFIIHKLFAVHGGCDHVCSGHCPLIKLIIKFLNYGDNKQLSRCQASCNTVHHLLHLFHMSMVPGHQIEGNNLVLNQSSSLSVGTFFCFRSWFPSSKRKVTEEKVVEEGAKQEGDEENGLKEETEEIEEDIKEEETGEEEGLNTNVSSFKRGVDTISCVSELCDAGVTFKMKRTARHMFDISFEKGIMEMPFMEIDLQRKIIFTNVVAFEQSQQHELSQTFTSYMALMDALVNTEKDVTLLEECGILENLLQNEEDAAVFYNHFGDFNTMDYENHYFRDLFIKVRKYSKSTWHKYRAMLMRDYFSSPWTIISVVAAGVLLVLTVVQTYYTVYPIHN